MKKSRPTEEQIAFALRQAELGITVAEVFRKMGISEATFYNWKKNMPDSNAWSLTSASTSRCGKRWCKKAVSLLTSASWRIS